MDLGPLRTLAAELNFDAHGVAVQVTRPREVPEAGAGIWQNNLSDSQPVGRDFMAREPRRLMAFRRSEFPDLERGTVVRASETIGGVARTWQIDGVELTETDYTVYILIASKGRIWPSS